jgi:hypothetical protein
MPWLFSVGEETETMDVSFLIVAEIKLQMYIETQFYVTYVTSKTLRY